MNDESKKLGQHLQSIVWMMSLLDEAEKACCGVTLTQSHALETIGKAGAISLNDLAGRLNLDKSTLSRTVSNLVAQGLCERSIDPDDRRYVAIRLTAAGSDIFEKIEGDMDACFGKIYHAIAPAHRKQILESAEILLNAIRQSGCCSQGTES